MNSVARHVPPFRPAIAALVVFGLMTFLPWVYFIDPPHEHPQILTLPFAAGMVIALTVVPKTRDWIVIAASFVMLLIIPANIVGHSLAHLLNVGCYD